MIKTKIQYRKALLSDLDVIKNITDANRKSLGFVLRPALASAIRSGGILVAEHQGKVIGFVHYHHRRDHQTTLYEIWVDEYFRWNGVGKSLISKMFEEMKSKGKSLVRLKAPVDLPANMFYQNLGFELSKVEEGKRRRLNVWELQPFKDGKKE